MDKSKRQWQIGIGCTIKQLKNMLTNYYKLNVAYYIVYSVLKYFLISIIVFGASVTLAQTPPTLIDTSDTKGFYKYLASQEISQLSIHELRQLSMLTFIEVSEATDLREEGLVEYRSILENLMSYSNNDPEIVAIRANFYGIEAREASNDMDALVFSKKATRSLDKLVRDNPDNGGVLMQRGLNALYTPSFAGRDAFIEIDFKELLSDRFALTGSVRAYVLYYLALGYKKIGDPKMAQSQLDEIIQLNVIPWSDMAKESN